MVPWGHRNSSRVTRICSILTTMEVAGHEISPDHSLPTQLGTYISVRLAVIPSGLISYIASYFKKNPDVTTLKTFYPYTRFLLIFSIH